MEIWVATGNTHKVEEIGQILGSGFEIKSLSNLPDFPEIIENGATYLENAEIKARALFKAGKSPVFADDSGLEVNALNGRPGIHSARYSGPNATHNSNIDLLLKELGDLPLEKRSAQFRCQIVYIDTNGISHNFEGVFPGYIGFERSGTGGFGYDPVFYLEKTSLSVSELPAEEKNYISHRGIAMKKLKRFLSVQNLTRST